MVVDLFYVYPKTLAARIGNGILATTALLLKKKEEIYERSIESRGSVFGLPFILLFFLRVLLRSTDKNLIGYGRLIEYLGLEIPLFSKSEMFRNGLIV